MAKRSKSEWKQLVAQWRQSGATADDFGSRRRLSSSKRKGTGRQRAVRRPGDGGVGGLVEVVPVQVASSAQVKAAETAVEIVVGPHVVRVRRGFDAGVLGEVLEVLAGGESC